jgi:hypothetical protein
MVEGLIGLRILNVAVLLFGGIGVAIYVFQIIGSLFSHMFYKPIKKKMPHWYKGFKFNLLDDIKEHNKLGVVFTSLFYISFWVSLICLIQYVFFGLPPIDSII